MSSQEPRLVLISGDEDGNEELVHVLTEGRTVVGRSPECDLELADTTVSRRHCVLIRDGNVVVVEAGDSHNPTRVNGARSEGQRLRDGDVVRFGRLQFRFKAGGASARAAAGRSPRRAGSRVSSESSGALATIGVVAGAVTVVGLIAWSIVSRNRDPGLTEDRSSASSLSPESARQLEAERRALNDEARFAALQGKLQERERSLRDLERKYQNELALLRQTLEAGREGEIETIRAQLDEMKASLTAAHVEREELAEELAAARSSAERRATTTIVPGVSSADSRAPDDDAATAMVQRKTPGPVLSASEVRDLVAALSEKIDDYASPEAVPESLEPELAQLSGSRGKRAADGLLDVHRHGRDLLVDLDRTVAFLKRRAKTLVAQADKLRGGENGEGSSKREGSRYAPSPEIEKLQRNLELSEKKVEIKERQRERLVALLAAVAGGIAQFRDEDAVRQLVLRFSSDRDVDQRLALAAAFETSRSRLAVPALIQRLGVSEGRLRNAVHQALIAIAGKDLGEKASDWKAWWAEENAR